MKASFCFFCLFFFIGGDKYRAQLEAGTQSTAAAATGAQARNLSACSLTDSPSASFPAWVFGFSSPSHCAEPCILSVLCPKPCLPPRWDNTYGTWLWVSDGARTSWVEISPTVLSSLSRSASISFCAAGASKRSWTEPKSGHTLISFLHFTPIGSHSVTSTSFYLIRNGVFGRLCWALASMNPVSYNSYHLLPS